MSKELCKSCGHPQSDHDGQGLCEAIIEQGKAFFICNCGMFEEE